MKMFLAGEWVDRGDGGMKRVVQSRPSLALRHRGSGTHRYDPAPVHGDLDAILHTARRHDTSTNDFQINDGS